MNLASDIRGLDEDIAYLQSSRNRFRAICLDTLEAITQSTNLGDRSRGIAARIIAELREEGNRPERSPEPPKQMKAPHLTQREPALMPGTSASPRIPAPNGTGHGAEDIDKALGDLIIAVARNQPEEVITPPDTRAEKLSEPENTAPVNVEVTLTERNIQNASTPDRIAMAKAQILHEARTVGILPEDESRIAKEFNISLRAVENLVQSVGHELRVQQQHQVAKVTPAPPVVQNATEPAVVMVKTMCERCGKPFDRPRGPGRYRYCPPCKAKGQE